MIQIIFIFSESFNDPSGPMDGSIIGLEETISITADHLHSIKLLSSRQKPWRQNVLNSIAEPLDTLFMELYLASGLYDKKKNRNMVTLYFFPTSLQVNAYSFTSLNCNLFIWKISRLIKYITLSIL